MSEIIAFTGITTVDEPSAGFLEKAKGWDTERCIVIGRDAKGALRFGASFSDVGEALLLLKQAERFLMDGVSDAGSG